MSSLIVPLCLFTIFPQKAPGEKAPAPAKGDGPDEVRGFRFDVLLKRKPEAAEALKAFREHLLESALEDDTLKVDHVDCLLTV